MPTGLRLSMDRQQRTASHSSSPAVIVRHGQNGRAPKRRPGRCRAGRLGLGLTGRLGLGLTGPDKVEPAGGSWAPQGVRAAVALPGCPLRPHTYGPGRPAPWCAFRPNRCGFTAWGCRQGRSSRGVRVWARGMAAAGTRLSHRRRRGLDGDPLKKSETMPLESRALSCRRKPGSTSAPPVRRETRLPCQRALHASQPPAHTPLHQFRSGA